MRSVKWLLPGLLLVAALIILSLSGKKPHANSPVGGVMMELASPIESVISSVTSGVENFWRDYLNLVGVKEENKKLKEQVARQKNQIVQMTEYKLANDRLLAILNFQAANPQYQYLAIKVLAWDPGPWFRAIIIDAGSNDGLELDQAVIHPQGVIGRIVEVSPHYAKILLATDFNSSIDAFIQRTRGGGLLAGQGGRPFSLKYVKKDEDVRAGDLIVTSGLDGVFPPGLALGTVSTTNRNSADMFVDVEVVPAVDFDRLEEVLVVKDFRPPIDWLGLGPHLRPILDPAGQNQ